MLDRPYGFKQWVEKYLGQIEGEGCMQVEVTEVAAGRWLACRMGVVAAAPPTPVEGECIDCLPRKAARWP